MAPPPVGLRARKKAATAAALQTHALELFLERGYDETTVQDITDAAGVSQRTFFRYYPTKDAVLLTEHARREADLRELLEGRRGQPLRETLDAVLHHLVEDIVERRELVQVQTRVYYIVPTMANAFAGHHDRLCVILAGHIADELGVADDVDPRPRLLAAQVTRAWTTAILLWLTAGTTGDLGELARGALQAARTDPLFVDPA
ncbi:TetR family transcriptional regulator [Iamia majanohamensis]|uniref:TetR family transcriptional regulator n=1 Tax=Iamia majanohamensis TaxID=467976 RepID=A0AAE9Y6J7_9ACTN|nr:TetR family transcriptional regulator [Iamia majanohamensis]WCO67620.1 TetR family transcriptional regulator [Iamia majanohamensis]